MLIAMLIAFMLCQADAGENAGAKIHEWGSRSGAFQLSIFSNKDEYVSGEEVHVTAVLKNVTDDLAYVQMPTPGMFYDIDIRLPFPTWINFKPKAVLTAFGQKTKNPLDLSVRGFRLQPRREMTYEFELSKLYDMSTIGDYHITFSCKLPLKNIGDPRVVVASNEIRVTIHPK
jgi:hypothetical protein